ncbi:MAG: fatty acid desaturase [Bdellovibrionales bacterium]|nr:fatty acid desaturase [Bdellovibrionales bacterium]
MNIDYVEENLEGDVDVQLACIKGKDTRRALPPEFFQRKPVVFLAKFGFALSLIAAASATIFLASNWIIIGVAILVNGFMFAHLIELQHECMHGHAFKSPGLNRLCGVACGVFMASSNAHYRYDHLRHHAWLGTPRNLEHFNYRFTGLNSFWGFTKAFFDLSRYKRVAKILLNTLLCKPVPGVDRPAAGREIKQEYVLFLAIVVASIAAAIYWPTLFWSIALAWWIPALLIAEGVHFMIEMPEHFGLNTMTEPNVLVNTRTIRTSRLVHWFVNGNDLHTAHHYHHGIPMCNVKKLHELIKDRIDVVEPSYFSLYKDILAGRINQDISVACMKR